VPVWGVSGRRSGGSGIAFLLLTTLVLAACGQKSGIHAEAQQRAGAGSLAGPDAGLGPEAVGSSAESPAAAGPAANTGGKVPRGPSVGTASGLPGGAGGAAGATASRSGGDATGVGNDSITIGVHAPVTGAAPFPATSFSQGKDVYFNFLNTRGGIAGRRVKVVFEDDGYNPGQAVSVCKKMVEQQHVFMLIGLGGTDQIVACAQYAASVGVPYVAEGVSEQGLNTLQNYFALSMTYKAQGPLLAQYMKRVLHVTKVGMLRANTANFDDAHTGFLEAARQLGLEVVFDRSIDKNADSQTAFSAGGSICANRANTPEAVYPLIAPTIWVQIVAGASAQACNPVWSGVGITEGLNTVGTAVCGASPATKAHFFSPFPALNVANQVDGDYNRAFQHQHGQTGDDIGWGIWGLEKLVSSMLAAPGRNLTRQGYVAAAVGKSFTTGVWPTVTYSASRFGGTAVHVLALDCTKHQYVSEEMNKSSF
jgi:branched-chain amino acid transport system substrate-binding protein